jgi:peptidyl-prolyl cis-trans isomerase D
MYRFFKRNREAVKKYLLIFFLSIVSIGMVITLAPIPTGDTSRMEGNVLASLDGSNITTQELQRSIQARFRNSPLGNDSRLIPLVAGNVLDEMILQQALVTQAHKLGLEATQQEFYQTLEGIPWLYPNGNFVGAAVASQLIQQQTGMSVQEFETLVRQSVLLDKIRGVVTDGVQVSPEEIHAEFLRRNTKAKIAYVLFDPSQYLKAVQITPQALAAYFQKDPSRYKIPEERQVRYVLITPDQVRAEAQVSDAELRQYYAQHLSDYRVPDRVKVAHILFKTTGKTPAEIATLEKTAKNVLAQIRAGANFGDLAKKYSEDSSAANGGEIGWITRGQTVKAFEDAAFSMKPGEVSGLVKTEYGIHIIKVEDKQTAHLQTFDEVKDAIRTELEKQRLEDAQQKLAAELTDRLKGDFNAVARQAGLDPKETPLFKYGQVLPDFGNSDSFQNLAFQLRPGEVGTPITVPKGLAIIQLVKAVPEHIPTLDEVRARVEEDYRADQSKVLAAEKAKEFAAQAKTGDFQKVARTLGLTVKESKDFSSQDYVEGVGSGSQLAEAFTLNPGQTSGVVPVGTGNSVVFRVVSHTPPNEAEFAAQRDRLAEEVLDQKRSLAFEMYRQNLKQDLLRSGKLKINEQAMKAFVNLYQNR